MQRRVRRGDLPGPKSVRSVLFHSLATNVRLNSEPRRTTCPRWLRCRPGGPQDWNRLLKIIEAIPREILGSYRPCPEYPPGRGRAIRFSGDEDAAAVAEVVRAHEKGPHWWPRLSPRLWPGESPHSS